MRTQEDLNVTEARLRSQGWSEGDIGYWRRSASTRSTSQGHLSRELPGEAADQAAAKFGQVLDADELQAGAAAARKALGR